MLGIVMPLGVAAAAGRALPPNDDGSNECPGSNSCPRCRCSSPVCAVPVACIVCKSVSRLAYASSPALGPSRRSAVS